jgi:hypothetical protein
MRKANILWMAGLVCCLLGPTSAYAGKTTAADFPLRVHVFSYNGHSHYSYGSLDMVDGEGRANLFENGEPKGFDFSYRCEDRLRVSPGYETYMARWKKSGRVLEILLPQFGKPGAEDGCELKVLMKDSAYIRHNGLLGEEPAADFKAWMVKHDYDPEHGKNEPAKVVSDQSAEPKPVSGAGPAQ